MRSLIAILFALALVATACGDDDDAAANPPAPDPTEDAVDDTPPAETAEPEPEPVSTEEPSDEAEPTSEPTSEADSTPTPDVPIPDEVVAADETGGTITRPIGAAVLPDGWVEEEFFFGGTATSYQGVGDLPTDGSWHVEAVDTAGYRTRLIVRRPPAADFSGIVWVEWFNVTAGTDNAVDWNFMGEELIRSGHAWVGVSVQAVGVNGVANPPEVPGLIDTRGLKVVQPERYGDLEHPGDAYAFDIYTQAGAIAAGLAGPDILGGLDPATVIAIGESQSAIFMTTYVNAFHPLFGLYDAFFIHSRGSGAPSPSAERAFGGDTVNIRTDLTEPVFMFQAEGDLTGLGFAAARQPDTDSVRTWEVAGTAHTDAYTLAAATGAPRSPDLGTILGCDPVNDGPHHETLQAAARHFVTWVTEGTPPPTSPLIDVQDGSIVRDELGLAVGGIRTPPVDVPIRLVTSEPSTEGGGFCFLFGQTLPIDPAVLAERYASAEEYMRLFEAAADDAVAAGFLLPEDAETMIEEYAALAEELLGS